MNTRSAQEVISKLIQAGIEANTYIASDWNHTLRSLDKAIKIGKEWLKDHPLSEEIKTERSKIRATIEGDMVYIPMERMGIFSGWMKVNKKYFSTEADILYYTGGE